jgi:hypothetical protein
MYFDDLTPYSYAIPRPLPDVVNIGWLKEGFDFSTGVVPSNFFEKIKLLIAKCSVNKSRGFHECDICKSEDRETIIYNEKIFYLGASEIWIRGNNNRIYASPDMIFHYLRCHSYMPPKEFIDAVECFDADSEWSAEIEFEKQMKIVFS